MRILLTQHQPNGGRAGIGGTQTYNATLQRELASRGHSVATWWPGALEKFTGAADQMARYDLAICSQNSTFPWARAIADRVIFVSHGLGELERPPAGADAYVAVSEEVYSHWPRWPGLRFDAERERPNCTIVRQPIDTERFAQDPETEPDIHVLRISTYGGLDWLPGLCEELGLSFDHAREVPPADMPRLINRARVVIAVGRGALEAMSCGKPVVIADERPYNEGALVDWCEKNGGGLRNYSGRGGRPFDRDLARAELEAKLRLCGSDAWRLWVAMFHGVREITDQLLALVDGTSS